VDVEVQPEFDREATERILRRAVRLGEPEAVADGISARALVEAAEELGVDPGGVLQAMSEERLGLLDERRSRADRLVGPPTVSATRLIPGSPQQVLDRADGWLRRACSLRRQRRSATSAEYTRRSDVAAGLQRAFRSISGQEDLRRVNRLRVQVRAVDGERCVVALVADLSGERTAALVGGGGVAGAGATVSVVEALAWSPWVWLGVPASLAAGVGIMAARANGLSDVEIALAGALDRIAANDEPSGVLADVRRRLMGAAGQRVRRGDPSAPSGAHSVSPPGPVAEARTDQPGSGR
jgi:hypothetical protein